MSNANDRVQPRIIVATDVVSSGEIHANYRLSSPDKKEKLGGSAHMIPNSQSDLA